MQEAETRPYHHGDLRRTIIETAMDMLPEEKGWQFTMREVARRAGVSHAAPYKHFPDRAALLTEMALLGFDRLREAMLKARPTQSKSLREEFIAEARAYVRFGTLNPALYRLMLSGDAVNTDDVHLNQRALATFGVLLDILERGQAEGAVRRRDVRGQAAGCWAQLHGITMLTIDGLFRPEKVGLEPLDAALVTLLEGIEC